MIDHLIKQMPAQAAAAKIIWKQVQNLSADLDRNLR